MTESTFPLWLLFWASFLTPDGKLLACSIFQNQEMQNQSFWEPNDTGQTSYSAVDLYKWLCYFAILQNSRSQNCKEQLSCRYCDQSDFFILFQNNENYSMLMYHLTQEAIIKFFEISILSKFDHNNFKCATGFSQNFNVFDKIHTWDYDDQEVDKNHYCIARLKLTFWLVNPRSVQSHMDLQKAVWTSNSVTFKS